jgi:4-hydroxy-3-methylbut-2-enyl diphosphate reductase
VIGTMGQPPGAITLVETVEDASAASRRAIPANLAFVTQTTLSVDDTAEIVAALRARFPAIVAPHKEDICYATTNRQDAVKAIAPQDSDLVLVIGAPTSLELRAAGRRSGAARGARDWTWFEGVTTLGHRRAPAPTSCKAS